MSQKQVLALLLTGLLALSFAPFVPTESSSSSASRKLDPRLQILQQKHEQNRLAMSKSVELHQQTAGAPLVGLLVKTKANAEELAQRYGGALGSSHGDIHTLRLPVTALPELTAEAGVEYVEASSVLYPELITSVPQTGARVLQNLPGTYALTGKGVIVGITDTGIDWRHGDFKNPDGTTRILFIWDQFLRGAGITPPAGFNYGAEFTAQQINSGAVSHRDADGHGTHVASIAAGNGLSTGGVYAGMAPDADIIAVRGGLISPLDGGASSGGFLDGYAYIRGKAEALGKRHVINTSFGTTLGPHDGSTLYEQAINANVAQGSIITNSAGNYAQNAWHAEAIVPPQGEVVLEFNAPANANIPDDELQIDIWYNSNDRIDVEVAGPNIDYLNKIPANGADFFDTADGYVSVISIVNSPLNGDNQIFIQMDHTGSAASEIASGVWRIRFTPSAGNNLPDGGEIDAWTERDDNATFRNFVDTQETINYPSTADSVIAVASYDNASGALSNFSSLGPRRDGVNKPDIAAIGGSVIAALSSFTSDSPVGDSAHVRFSGTSMSAPHVCGAIALMLQADSTLTPAQVRKLLYQAARADQQTGAVPNHRWGHGKLDIFTPLLPYISQNVVSGLLEAQATGASVKADLTFRLKNSPFGETIAAIQTGDDGRYSINIPPGQYAVEIVPELPYPILRQDLLVENDSTDFSLQLTPARIILVNDDPAGSFASYYTSTLDSLGWSYGVHTNSKGTPVETVPAIEAVDYMIWFTGNASGEVLTANEQQFLVDFLDGGGRLFLSGQNIAESLSDSDFLTNRLHVSLERNSINDFLLHGVRDDDIGKDLSTVITTGTGGANNQTSRDVIVPDSLAHAVMVYDTTAGTVAGVRVVDPVNRSRLVFFSFGFEAINLGVPRPGYVDRRQVLQSILAWLEGTTAVAAPRHAGGELPASYAIQQSYPNPIRLAHAASPAIIRYQIPARQPQPRVVLKIYDLLGREVLTLIDAVQQPGYHHARWDGRDRRGEPVTAGIYFYRMLAGDFRAVGKMAVMP